MTILDRNLRVGAAELDIVACEGRAVVVVEVRMRGAGAFTGPLGSVDAAKRERLRRAGERLWQTRYAADAGVDTLRFDVIAVTSTPERPLAIEWVRAAF